MDITVETYTYSNGSNMDRILYEADTPLYIIIADIKTYDNWDYAVISGDDYYYTLLREMF